MHAIGIRKRVAVIAAVALCACAGWVAGAAAGEVTSDWPNACAYDFVPPVPASMKLTRTVEHIRRLWSVPIHTGFGKGGIGSITAIQDAGFEPTFGETASPVVADGVLLVSWSEATGDVSADPGSLTDRYFRNEERMRPFADTYLRIDANWNTVALDIETGEVLWRRSEPSASINFVSSKRGHNGIDGATGGGVYVTISILGHVFAYDIKTGAPVWQYTLKDWNERAEAQKREALEQKRLPGIRDGIFGYKRSGAVVVDGMAVVPDLRGGLVGLNLKGGTEVWHAPNRNHDQAMPRPWVHDGKAWLLCHNARGRGDSEVHLLDPQTGETAWSYKTGNNPGQLLMGEGHVLLNPHAGGSTPARMRCYRITSEGLDFRWQFPDEEEYEVRVRADRGAERHGVIHDGVVYLIVGNKNRLRLTSFDLESGERLYTDGRKMDGNVGCPVILKDMLYFQVDSAHTGPSGLAVYELLPEGRYAYLGDALYSGFNITLLIDYEHPTEYPYANGKIFLRGEYGIHALDLRVPETPATTLQFHGLWGGFHRPVEAVLFTGSEGAVQEGTLESPPRGELGIIGSKGWRSDMGNPITLETPLVAGQAGKSSAEMGFRTFSWPGTLTMEADGEGAWVGTWTRPFKGWEETQTLNGELDGGSVGGYTRRGWPTGWLEDQPFTFTGDLKEGQNRIVLQMHNAIPMDDKTRNLTVCIDHDGAKVVSAIGGAFSFNQSYHEVDLTDVVVDGEGLRGTGWIILNSDKWVPGDWRNGGSLLGRVTLALRFGEADAKGMYPVRGTWRIEWGIGMERTGRITMAPREPE